MRIGIPVTGNQVSNHLGAAERFLIVDVEDGKIVQTNELPNPGHGPGGPPPVFLAKLGVKQVVGWGMPAHATAIFEQLGIKVQLGAKGEPNQVLADFLGGTLKLTTEGLDGGSESCH